MYLLYLFIYIAAEAFSRYTCRITILISSGQGISQCFQTDLYTANNTALQLPSYQQLCETKVTRNIINC